jgi:hypothetical protein
VGPLNLMHPPEPNFHSSGLGTIPYWGASDTCGPIYLSTKVGVTGLEFPTGENRKFLSFIF